MNFKSYSLNVFFRVLLLAASMLAFFYSSDQDKWYVTTTVSGILIPVFFFSLIRYTHRFRKEISNFLMAIQNREYSQYKRSQLTAKSGELDQAFHIIANELQNVSIEKEAHYHYLRAIVENINIGIISYMESGEIHLFNRAASKLLNMPVLKNIETVRKYYIPLYNVMKEIKPGERKLINLKVNNELMKLALQLREFKQYGYTYKLFSLQDIRSELNAQEIESYQKLIKVLRHEIMNSATPISSLSEAMKDSLEDMIHNKEKTKESLTEELDDLLVSINTVNTRTKGLLKFIQNYRKLTSIPEPTLAETDLYEVINHSLHLLSSEMKDKNIEVKKNLHGKQLLVNADFDQIEQVVINILLNAIHATENKEQGRIEITGRETDDGAVQIRFKDNGIGISEMDLEKVFVPFYTTKKNGSGIGLSLARQIMKMHRGDIQISSTEKRGTTCELNFE